MGGRGASSGGSGGGGKGNGDGGGNGSGGNGQKKDASSSNYVTTYKSDNGGQVITQQGRIDQANKSKNEMTKYQKEQRIAEKLADSGHTVVHLDDSNVADGSYDALVDGVKTDFKETSSANNIGKYAKHAIEDQKAQRVVYNFTKVTDATHSEINKLSGKGIHGYYFVPGKSEPYEF